MPRFFIEVPHGAGQAECVRAAQIFLMSGSHFLTNAEWGCMDGEHKAWLIVDVDSRQDAESIVPPSYRPQAKIVKLNRFTMNEMGEAMRHHEPQS
jgi:hypothetical protein